jgi:multiple sugar transport system permease protein
MSREQLSMSGTAVALDDARLPATSARSVRLRRRGKLFARHTILIWASLVAVFPLLWLLKTALGSSQDALASHPKWIFQPTFGAFRAVWATGFSKYLLNSAIIVLTSVAVVMVIGTFAGYALARFPIKGKEAWFFYMISTRMGPPIAFALPFYVIYNRLGLLDSYTGMVVVYAAVNLAFAVWMTRSFFEDIPASLEEAGMVDGLSRFRAFLRITLPLARGGLTATAIFVFIIAWNEFFYAAMLTREHARTFTTQIPNYVGFTEIRWEQMAAASIMGLIPVIAVALIVRGSLVRGFTFGQVR